jgi:GNAT superfamily N-acetyltransferase
MSNQGDNELNPLEKQIEEINEWQKNSANPVHFVETSKVPVPKKNLLKSPVLMLIKKIEDKKMKQEIARDILYDLPEWFGIPESTEAYIKDSADMVFYAAYNGSISCGFVAIQRHFKNSAEINVMGIHKEYHRKGIGIQLIKKACEWCLEEEIEFLQVKTLADTHPDIHYGKTREFYKAVGFEEIEVFPDLWGKENPCLMLMKHVVLD